MAFTYDPSKLSTNKIYQVRLSVGQTNQYDLIVLQDEEIEFFLSNSYDNVTDASVKAIDSMISRAGLLVDKETGQVSESASQLIDSLIKTRDDMLVSVSRNVPIHCQFTGFFEDDRKEQQDDTEIYHDGITNTSELPSTRILNGPVGPGSSPLNGSFGS